MEEQENVSRRDSAPKILFIRTDRLGETLLNLPAIAALKAEFPSSILTLLASPDLIELLAVIPGIDSVIPYTACQPRSWWLRAIRLAGQLRSQRFDITVISNPKKEFHLAVFLARIPLRVGYDRKWGWCLTHRLADRKAPCERHEVEYNLDLVRALGFPVSAPKWQLPRFDREQTEALQLLEQQNIKPSEPFIAVHPWTSNPKKQWPLARYQELIHLVTKRLRQNVVIVGGPEEMEQSKRLSSLRGRVADLVGRLTLRQLAALFQRAQLLVSNDSGPVHLAAAVGTPVIALFGIQDPGSHPRRWGPWGSGHVVIQKPLADLTVDEVFTAVHSAVDRPAQPRRGI
jgi:ADP-heptose:LPS heptosyltransferase